jgi:hypothetical protein
VSRAANIALRTAHVAAMGILLGGHAFRVDPVRLRPHLWLTVATGLGLALVEAGPRLVWFHQLRGLMTLAKLVLLCAVPFCWGHRVVVLLVVLVIASVGSHMPARLRYYSVVRREVIPDGSGPGTSQLAAQPGDEDS